MKNAVLAKKSIWTGMILLMVVVVGIAFSIWQSKSPSEPLADMTENAPANTSSQKSDAKTFRQTLSDMAWGRGRKEGPAIKPEARVAPAADSPGAQQQAMMTLQSRMAYCAQNWQKDPSCGIQPKTNKAKQ